MLKRVSLLLCAGLAAQVMISGCAGLNVWQKGHYYKSEVVDSASKRDVSTVGVYVFSQGEGDRVPYGEFTVRNWPSTEVQHGETFSPDTVNSGPSLEFANALARELGDRGYNTKVVTDMGHSHEVSVEQCLANAKQHGYDGAFIAHYASFSTKTHFVYFPNGGFFEIKTGDELWKNSYYGLLENSHFINLSNEPFVEIVSSAVTENGDETYIKAAPKAAKMLLEPDKFPGTTKPFPSKGERKHRM